MCFAHLRASNTAADTPVRLSKCLLFPTFSLTAKIKELQYYFLVSMPVSIQEYLRGKVTQVMRATMGDPWCTSEYEKSM